jgi:hypothetical protein
MKKGKSAVASRFVVGTGFICFVAWLDGRKSRRILSVWGGRQKQVDEGFSGI